MENKIQIWNCLLVRNFNLFGCVVDFLSENELVAIYYSCKVWQQFMRREELKNKWEKNFKNSHPQFYSRLTFYSPEELFKKYMDVYIDMQIKDGKQPLNCKVEELTEAAVGAATQNFESMLETIKQQVQLQINEYKENFNWLDAFLEIGKFRNSFYAKKLVETEPLISTEENLIGFLKWSQNEHVWSKKCKLYLDDEFHTTQRTRDSKLDDWLDKKFPPYRTVHNKEPLGEDKGKMNVWNYNDFDDNEAPELYPIIRYASYIIRKLFWFKINCQFYTSTGPASPSKVTQYINEWGIDTRVFYLRDKYPEFQVTSLQNVDCVYATFDRENKALSLEFLKSCMNFIELIYSVRPQYEAKLLEAYKQ